MRYAQFSLPKIFKKEVPMTTIVSTPKAYREWRKLISRWGLSEGMAAMTGLRSASERPADREKITVPITSPP